jgi:hypothetical protein
MCCYARTAHPRRWHPYSARLIRQMDHGEQARSEPSSDERARRTQSSPRCPLRSLRSAARMTDTPA